jgi:hypothetical protein
MKFRKKPVVIEAERYDGTIESVKRILNMGGRQEIRNSPEGLYIETLEGVMRADNGDWVKGTMRADNGDWAILGAKGELYPCKPDIFDATYEPV